LYHLISLNISVVRVEYWVYRCLIIEFIRFLGFSYKKNVSRSLVDVAIILVIYSVFGCYLLFTSVI